jgi:hypothetical protein
MIPFIVQSEQLHFTSPHPNHIYDTPCVSQYVTLLAKQSSLHGEIYPPHSSVPSATNNQPAQKKNSPHSTITTLHPPIANPSAPSAT